jgi:hypothetical protein
MMAAIRGNSLNVGPNLLNVVRFHAVTRCEFDELRAPNGLYPLAYWLRTKRTALKPERN